MSHDVRSALVKALQNKDILGHIFAFLPLRDLFATSLVCRLWKHCVWRGARRLCFRTVATNLRVEVMERIIHRCPAVTHVDLSTCDQAAGVLRGQQIARIAPQLISLRLLGCNLQGVQLETVCARMSALRRLDVAEVGTFTLQALRSVGHATAHGLTWLDVSKSAALTDDLVRELGAFTRLRHLALDSGVPWSEPAPPPPSLVLRPLAALARLTELHLARVPFADQALAAAVRGWPHLQRLYVYRAHRLGGLAVDALAKTCTALRKLKVWDAPEVTDEAAARLVARCTTLTVLALYDTGVSAAFIANTRLSTPRLKLKGEGRRR